MKLRYAYSRTWLLLFAALLNLGIGYVVAGVLGLGLVWAIFRSGRLS